MANTQLSLIPQNFPVTVNMLVVLKGAEKMEAEMKGLRGKVAAFKKSMEDSGLEPLDVAGFISEGGLLKPFQDGIKKAIEAQDALAKKTLANKHLKVPKVVHGETSANLEKFNEALDKISLNIGQALLPAVNGIVTALTPVITSIGQFVANNPYLVEGLAAAAVAFTVVTVGAMGLVAVLGILTSPIGLIAAAIAAAVAVIVIGARLITDNWGSISGFFSETWQSLSASTRRGIDKVQKGWDEMVTGAKLKFDSMQASAKQKWEEMKADAVAGASRLAEGATARLNAFGAMMGELWDSAGAVVKDYWNDAIAGSVAGLEALKANLYTSPKAKLAEVWGATATVFGEFWDSAAAKAATGMEALKANLYTSPKAKLAEVWDSTQTVFSGFWNRAATSATTGWATLKATFDGSLADRLSGVWGSALGMFSGVLDNMRATASAGWEQLKSTFSWSPFSLIQSNWQPLGEVFSALWDVLRASALMLKSEFQNLFNFSPMESAVAQWDGLKGYFSGLWTALTTEALSVANAFGTLFSQSPMESIKQAWEPILGWFSELWAKLQSVVAPIRELLNGNLSGVVATITGQSPAAASGSSAMTSSLPQSSGALIQQSAANNRTQLEGGLTVRFENAPAGLRTDQPQTNQPGLALSSRIGYRSLSMGGSNELA